jgi:hypothetical protein
MPKKGFKSYIMKDRIYNFWRSEYETKKDELKKSGINSFSAFLTFLMSSSMNSVNKSAKGHLELVYFKDDIVAIQDNIKNRVAELSIKNGKIYCILDKRDNCIHVGFAYSFPQINRLLNKKI